MARLSLYLALLVVALASYAALTAPRIRIDGFLAEPFDLLGLTDTQYAEGYTHRGFNRIEVGMKEREVIGILGEPLYRWSPYDARSVRKRFPEKAHYVALSYSRSPSSTHYRLRQVILDRGVVKEIRGYFYMD